MTALAIDGGAVALTYFLVLFNTRAVTYKVCDAYSEVCMEDDDSSCKVTYTQDTDVGDWQALMYLIGVSLMMAGEGLWGYLLAKPYGAVVVPAIS